MATGNASSTSRVSTIKGGDFEVARILLAEDDRQVREVLQEMLEFEGYEVVTAATGSEALRRLKSEPPDLVVTDILMEDIDGMELISIIRRDNPTLPVIAISGGGKLNADFYLNMSAQLGADLQLEKPFTPDELKSAVARCLRNSPS